MTGLPANADRWFKRVNDDLAGAPVSEIFTWAKEELGDRVIASSSFQTNSVVLLHQISLYWPELPVLFLDTGFHFKETLAFRDQLAEEYGLNVVNSVPRVSKEQLFERLGSEPWKTDAERCCWVNKVEPMRIALEGYDGWITGVRGDQTDERSKLRTVEPGNDGKIKIHPMIGWSKSEIWEYIREHKLPEHPLFVQGYASIGCEPCTVPVAFHQNEREGRWAGTGKRECGLHLKWDQQAPDAGAQEMFDSVFNRPGEGS